MLDISKNLIINININITKKWTDRMGRKEEIFFDHLGMHPADNSDGIILGETYPYQHPEAVIKICDEYHALIEKSIKLLQGETARRQLRAKQGITSREYYKTINRNPVSGEDYEMQDERDYQRFINQNQNQNELENFANSYLKHLYDKFPNMDILKFFFTGQKIALNEKERQKHTFITGKSGSGKSEALKYLMHDYLKKNKNNCLILIDPHGDLAEEVARLNSAKSRNIIYFDPFLDRYKIPCLNPLEIQDRSEASIDSTTQELTRVFEETLKNASLSLQMEALLKPCIATLLRKGNSNLFELMRFMDDEKNGYLVQLGKKSPNRVHADFFENGFLTKQYAPTKASIYTKLQSLLNSEAFFNITCNKSTINLEEEINKKNLIIFSLSKGKIGVETSEVFGRFIVSMVQTLVLKRAKIHASNRLPIHFFIDECQNYITKSIEIILTEARKYGLYLTLATQFLGQNTDTQIERAILSNTNIKLTGMNAHHTLSIIARETGEKLETLQTLKLGQFACKCGSSKSLIVKIPTDLIGNRQSITRDEWEYKTREIIRSYYSEPNFEREEDGREEEQQGESNNTHEGKERTKTTFRDEFKEKPQGEPSRPKFKF